MTSATPAKEHCNMDVIPPPAYEGKDRTKLYTVAATTILVTLLVGFFVVYVLLIATPAPSLVNTVSTVVERDVTYTMKGVEHHERMEAQGDILTIQNTDDGFTAIFDQGRSLMMIKNETTGYCFFARAMNLNISAVGNVDWFFVEESNGKAGPSLASEPNTRVFIFEPSAPLPPEYVSLTSDPVIARRCTGDSYWVVPKNSQRQKRSWLSEAINKAEGNLHDIFVEEVSTAVTLAVLGLFG